MGKYLQSGVCGVSDHVRGGAGSGDRHAGGSHGVGDGERAEGRRGIDGGGRENWATSGAGAPAAGAAADGLSRSGPVERVSPDGTVFEAHYPAAAGEKGGERRGPRLTGEARARLERILTGLEREARRARGAANRVIDGIEEVRREFLGGE